MLTLLILVLGLHLLRFVFAAAVSILQAILVCFTFDFAFDFIFFGLCLSFLLLLILGFSGLCDLLGDGAFDLHWWLLLEWFCTCFSHLARVLMVATITAALAGLACWHSVSWVHRYLHIHSILQRRLRKLGLGLQVCRLQSSLRIFLLTFFVAFFVISLSPFALAFPHERAAASHHVLHGSSSLVLVFCLSCGKSRGSELLCQRALLLEKLLLPGREERQVGVDHAIHALACLLAYIVGKFGMRNDIIDRLGRQATVLRMRLLHSSCQPLHAGIGLHGQNLLQIS
mmetsp:Transcript_44867/g.104820  ORF Transcript_44867/g.104820 Transcript_44867/m.104820 type:complete len:285 (+) Transcript_44867:361-1215(+)